ncbi:MAG: hypothetical protein ACPGJS_17900 [Flammeovirgaceae bacterium]
MRRRISEAGVFELIKRKFPDDQWEKNTDATEEDPPTWGLLIHLDDEEKENACQVLRYADKTLYSMEISEEDDDDDSNHRPTPKQLEQLFEYVINLD